jgi:hypothetical protein
MALTELEIRAAKAVEKPLKLFDGGELYLLVTHRWWRLKYRYEGKKRGISLGVYPDVSLKRARICRDDARRMIAEGVDPSVRRQAIRMLGPSRSNSSPMNGSSYKPRSWDR